MTRRKVFGAFSALIGLWTPPFLKRAKAQDQLKGIAGVAFEDATVGRAETSTKAKREPNNKEVNEDFAQRLATARKRLEADPGFAGKAFSLDASGGIVGDGTNAIPVIPPYEPCPFCGKPEDQSRTA